MQYLYPFISQEILNGLIIGIGAGISTTVIIGIYHWFTKYRNRREQISYIRNLMSTQIKRILTATDLPPYASGKESIPADCVRFVYFREFESAFLVALSSRTTELTYKEIFSLQKIFADIDRAITDLTLRERGILPLTIAESFYQKLKDLDWLKLPDRDELKIIDQRNSN